MGLKMPERLTSWRFSDKDKARMVESWKGGQSFVRIARQFDCDNENVRLLASSRLEESEYKKIACEHMKRYTRLIRIRKPRLNPALAWWIGVVKGDGHINTRTGGGWDVSLHSKDEDLSNKWSVTGQKLFGLEPKSRKYKQYFIRTFYSNELVRFIKSAFGEFGTHVWNIPEAVSTSSAENRAAFISGLFDAEGCAKQDKNSLRLTFVSVQETCVKWLVDELKSMGINARFRNERKPNRGCTYFVINIGCYQNIKRFNELIGFSIKRKERRIQSYMRYMEGLKKWN